MSFLMPECYIFDYIDEDDVYLEGDEIILVLL